MNKISAIFGKVPVLAWFFGGSVVIVLVGVVLVMRSGIGKPVDDTKPLPVSKEVSGTQVFSIVGREHVPPGTSVSTYNSNPPTSGPHWVDAAQNGIYDHSLPDEQIVHDLEHGYIWISYKNDASDEVKNKLKALVQNDNWKIILEPRDKDENTIALTAWGRVLGLSDWDEAKIKSFIETYRDKGPEKTTT